MHYFFAEDIWSLSTTGLCHQYLPQLPQETGRKEQETTTKTWGVVHGHAYASAKCPCMYTRMHTHTYTHTFSTPFYPILLSSFSLYASLGSFSAAYVSSLVVECVHIVMIKMSLQVECNLCLCALLIIAWLKLNVCVSRMSQHLLEACTGTSVANLEISVQFESQVLSCLC